MCFTLFLFPGCNQKDSCLDDGSEAPKQIESNNDDTSSELPETNQGNDNKQNEVSKKNVSNVSITDTEKLEIQSILASAEQIDIEGNKYIEVIYHSTRSEKLSFMSDRENVSCRTYYEPVIIDERDVFGETSESRYMYLFFNYIDDGRDYTENVDSVYDFMYRQNIFDEPQKCMVFSFNRNIPDEVSCIEPSERTAIVKMNIVEDLELFELRLNKIYEGEIGSLRDMIQDPTTSIGYKLPDVSNMTGNLKVESCFFDRDDKYILPEEIFDYNQDKYSENALIYTEKELCPESEEENYYLLFSFRRPSDNVHTLIGDSANLKNGIIELKFKLVEGGGTDAFTDYVVILKLSGLNGLEHMADLHLEFEYMP